MPIGEIDTLVLLLSLGEFCAKLSKDNLTGHKIEMATTCVLEECDIRRRSPSFQGFAGKIIKVPEHVRFLNRTACDGLQDVPHAIKSGFPPVDKDKGSPSRYVVRFTSLRRIAANQIKVDTGP